MILSMCCLLGCTATLFLFNHNPFIRGFIGDFVFVSMLYFIGKSISDFHSLKLSAGILLLSYATEFSQYFHVLKYIGLNHYKAARIIFGSVFDPVDLCAYTLGIIFALSIDRIWITRGKVCERPVATESDESLKSNTLRQNHTS